MAPFVVVILQFMDGTMLDVEVGPGTNYYTWKLNQYDRTIVFLEKYICNRLCFPLMNVRSFSIEKPGVTEYRKDYRGD